ncbi:unnamed protein product [Rotaria sordida]|uniref:Uncharacterized protein n=1 Tax=Rotaria sordida TaxID=392033 RepID=A0A815XEW8_9BILA|nr:unnamed protein product [Rotaria sordida]CAF1336794.1 unnamed protein product [Rotaria sordida]CAF1556549.1 unnamed protein product [Rotaria sordida]CAF3927666.1 unnamed protein product [Rotaria sordida]
MAKASAYGKLIALSQVVQDLSGEPIDNEIEIDTEMAEIMAAKKRTQEAIRRLCIREMLPLLDTVDGVQKLKQIYPCKRMKI